jgi:hypothetical protein
MTTTNFLINYAPLIVSACSLLFSVLAWRKSRVIYEVVTSDNRPNSNLNELLSSGKYTILHVQADPSNPMRTLYTLGRISDLLN